MGLPGVLSCPGGWHRSLHSYFYSSSIAHPDSWVPHIPSPRAPTWCVLVLPGWCTPQHGHRSPCTLSPWPLTGTLGAPHRALLVGGCTQTHAGRNCPFCSTKVCTGWLQLLLQGSLPLTCHAGHLHLVCHRTAWTCHALRSPLHKSPLSRSPVVSHHPSATSASQCIQVFLHIIEVKEKTILLWSYGLNIQLIFGM